MNLKIHLCGRAVIYDHYGSVDKDKLTFKEGRYQGSLYSQQRKQIADAATWLYLNQNRKLKPVIFVLTSPAFTSIANTPKFISSFFENMKLNYGLGNYVWVRELTKKGFPHFHVIAHWHPMKYFFENDSQRMKKINLYWSSLFDCQSLNSVRFGSYHPKTKVRSYYLNHDKQVWYITKYLGKSINDRNSSYLCESGFPQTVYKKAVRSFAISNELALLSEPETFVSDWIQPEKGSFAPAVRKWFPCDQFTSRLKGYKSLSDSDLSVFDWHDTGHANTFLGTSFSTLKETKIRVSVVSRT